jgi:hypothetical protein
MLTGNVHRSDARLSNDNTSICGIIPVSWQGNSWAISCKFEGNDLSEARGQADICTSECDATPGKETKTFEHKTVKLGNNEQLWTVHFCSL